MENMFQTNTNSETIWECLGDRPDSKLVIGWVQIQIQVLLQLLTAPSHDLSDSDLQHTDLSFLPRGRWPGSSLQHPLP